MRTYILNLRTRVLHSKVDGRTHESCNLDQVKRLREYADPGDGGPPPLDVIYRACDRCMR